MDTLLIFTREPRPGLAGRGLVPPLDPAQAALLSHAMLRDTLRQAGELENARVRLCVSPGSKMGFMEGDYEWEKPLGLTLGRRMARSFQSAFRLGGRVVALRADAPTLGAPALREAFQSLEQASLCVIGEPRGGVVALGLARYLPVFDGVEWESRRSFRQLCERAQALGLKARELEKVEAVEDGESLEPFRRRLRRDPGSSPLAALTLQAFLTPA